jgi:hypothetical protein
MPSWVEGILLEEDERTDDRWYGFTRLGRGVTDVYVFETKMPGSSNHEVEIHAKSERARSIAKPTPPAPREASCSA